MNKNRISVYISDDIKKEWIKFAKSNNFSTLSKLIREAIEFFIDYKSKIISKDKKVDINLLSNLSHELKEPLTSIKAYLQFITEEHNDSMEDDLKKMARNAFNQCINLERKIVENLEKPDLEKFDTATENNKQYDILIIDDSIETVNFLTTYFRRKGYSCKGVFSGLNGLKELRHYTPKILLLDIILPDISGYEVFKTIKSMNTLKNVIIFFLTAIPSSEVEKEAQALKPTGIIYKPFSLTDFEEIYKHLI
ncbi:MAG: response regulator [Promethearchaeota archaeon]